jgi:predicted RecA/RadA family phage recombinase
MATNFRHQGVVVQGTNGSGSAIVSGQPILLGDQGIAGICLEDIANAAAGSVQIEGVFDYPCKGHNGTTSAAIAAYDKVYYTAGEAFCDTDSSASLLGYALEAVSSGSTTTVKVLIARA